MGVVRHNTKMGFFFSSPTFLTLLLSFRKKKKQKYIKKKGGIFSGKNPFQQNVKKEKKKNRNERLCVLPGSKLKNKFIGAIK